MNSFREDASQYIHKINAENFTDIALELFRYQYAGNEIYRDYVNTISWNVADVDSLEKIPFLPISFFKSHQVITGIRTDPQLVFESSGTTGEIKSRHVVFSEDLYNESLLQGFRSFYGSPSEYAILALLPSYLERKHASLVHMADLLMKESEHPLNGFYLDEWTKLSQTLLELETAGQPTLLLGVTFALLDFADAYPMKLANTIVMETGGMKGRKQEWTRSEVHNFLRSRWQLDSVHSEYGMTELLSQAYSKKDGIFEPSPTMVTLVRDINDPFDTRLSGSGCLNIIDLANTDSCAFIATEDIGQVYSNGTFSVSGRLDHSALRGCSLMTA